MREAINEMFKIERVVFCIIWGLLQVTRSKCIDSLSIL